MSQKINRDICLFPFSQCDVLGSRGPPAVSLWTFSTQRPGQYLNFKSQLFGMFGAAAGRLFSFYTAHCLSQPLQQPQWWPLSMFKQSACLVVDYRILWPQLCMKYLNSMIWSGVPLLKFILVLSWQSQVWPAAFFQQWSIRKPVVWLFFSVATMSWHLILWSG